MRILLVDDNELFLGALRRMLELHNFEVVGTAINALEAIALSYELHPDVVLMDIDMPGANGIEALQAVKEVDAKIRVVMMTVSDSDDNLFGAVSAGADGYLLKSMTEEDLLETLGLMGAGETPLSKGLAGRILSEFARRQHVPVTPREPLSSTLSQRQKEVLHRVAQGLTYDKIASELQLSEATIRYHMTAIARQLNLKTRSQVIAYASRYLQAGPEPLPVVEEYPPR